MKGWSTEELKNEPSSSLAEDSEEMMAWRTTSQEEMDDCRKKLAGKIEGEALDKYKVDDNRGGAYRGRGSFRE